MNIWQLLWRETAHRKWNFLFGMLAVAVAVTSFVGALNLLHAHEIHTQKLLTAQQSELETRLQAQLEAVRKAGTEWEDAARKITKGLGFNILILPGDQNLNELHTEGTLTQTMPESKVTDLSESRAVTINHLLPLVMKKLQWEEQGGQTVILTGTKGEVPFLHRALKKPLRDQVPKGTIELGYLVHTQRQLKADDEVELLGRTFQVTTLHEEQGTIDDSRVWVNLTEAQEMLQMENLVHGILALECNCATVDRVGEIREELTKIVPGTQIIERGSKALARAETRNKAKAAAEQALAHEEKAGQLALADQKKHRSELKADRERLAGVLVPLVIVAAAIIVGVLAWWNVKQRETEIGILRAIGVKTSHVLTLYLGKALMLGLCGAVIGYVIGVGIANLWGETSVSVAWNQTMLLALLLAPTLAVMATWLPALLAVRQDPALVLSQD